jgi:chromosome segregation ATPase
MEYIELKDFVNEEFPKFYMMINTERKELSLDIEKRAQEEKWSKEKNNKESKAQEIEERIRSLTSEISKIKELKESKRKIYAEYNRLQKIDNEWKKFSDETLKDFDEFKTSITDKEMHETIIQFSISSKDDLVNKLSKSKIEKDNITQNINSYSSIDKLEKDEKEARRQLEILKREIKEKYERFIFKPGISEVSHTKKNNHNSIKQLPCPKYPLPEVGELFEDSNSYYLEIEHYEEISKANEIAKNRYIDKPCHVVAKERK